MVSCILLAAGQSRRFGSPKSLAPLGQNVIIEHAQDTVIRSTVDELIVVLGAHSKDIKPFILEHRKVQFVYNKDHNFGQTSSFQAGLRKVHPDSRAVFLLPVDCPFVAVETFNALSSAFAGQNSKSIVVPTFRGQKGHPPLFDIKLKEEFLRLDPALGLNTVAHHHKDVWLFPVEDKGVAATFNTPEELRILKDRLS